MAMAMAMAMRYSNHTACCRQRSALSLAVVVVLLAAALALCSNGVIINISVDAFGMVHRRAVKNGRNIGNHHHHHHNKLSFSTFPTTTTTTRTTTTTALFAALPKGYQEFGNDAIRNAARLCGMDIDGENSKNRLDIEWKAGTIVVTVHGEVSLAAGGSGEPSEGGVDDGVDDGVGDDDEGLLEDPFSSLDLSAGGGETEAADPPPEEFSLTLLARTINRVLDDDGTGLAIAEVHSIEVTTPGVSDELVPGTPQFDAFRGFEIIVEQLDPKKKKKKTIEGRLVERNDEFTIVNIKGRMKKMKNETVLSVRLPKAKKEKGGR